MDEREVFLHINPDHFLQTDQGRVLTPERNRQAWSQSFAALQEGLDKAKPGTQVHVLIGAQGAGKSRWVRAQWPGQTDAIFFDAILVKRAERAPIVAAAKARSLRVVAVWFKTPLALCLARNAARPPDEVVSEQALRNVHAAVEAPSLDEGFDQIIVIS